MRKLRLPMVMKFGNDGSTGDFSLTPNPVTKLLLQILNHRESMDWRKTGI